jgi:5-methylcytosine-specific restriction endonuclease McrA
MSSVTRQQREAERRRLLIAKGRCGGHKDRFAVEGMTSCQECLDRAKERSRANVMNGRCSSHKDRMAVEGHTSCQDCLDHRSENGPHYHKMRLARDLDGRRRDADVTRVKIWRRDGGICVYCHQPVMLHGGGYHLAHYFVPLVLGGTTTWDNLRCSHKTCNLTRPRAIRDDCPPELRAECLAWMEAHYPETFLRFFDPTRKRR